MKDIYEEFLSEFVDISDLSKDDIRYQLSILERANTYQDSFKFKALKVNNFYIRIGDPNISVNKKLGHKWKKKDLDALPKVTELEFVNCAIYSEVNDGIRRVYCDDSRFQIYSDLFNNYGLIKSISIDTLCSIIYYCMRLKNLSLLI